MSASERRPAALPADLRARILEEVARTPAPTRREHRSRVALIAGSIALVTAVLFFATGGFAPGGRPIELIAFMAGSGLLAALVLTRVSAGRGGSMLGRPRQVLILACIAPAPLLVIVAFIAAVLWPERSAEIVQPKTHLACALITIAQGALPLLALIVPKRGSDPVHPAIAGAALGMAAGAWTVMMAYLRCPHAATIHCIVAHVIPTLVLVAAGALLGRVFLKIR